MKKVKRKKQLPTAGKKNYVNNKEFLEEIIKHKTKVAENNGNPVQVSDKLARYFIKVATNLGSKGNFVSYSYKDEMIADSIENCLRYMHNFNPEKSSNPFSYFSQIIWYAFVRRIKAEHTNTYVKYKTFLTSDLLDNDEILTMLQNNDSLIDDKREFVRKYEESLKNKKPQKKVKEKPLNKFIE